MTSETNISQSDYSTIFYLDLLDESNTKAKKTCHTCQKTARTIFAEASKDDVRKIFCSSWCFICYLEISKQQEKVNSLFRPISNSKKS